MDGEKGMLTIAQYAKQKGYSRAYIHKLIKAGRIATISKKEVVLYIPEGTEIKPSKRTKGRPKKHLTNNIW